MDTEESLVGLYNLLMSNEYKQFGIDKKCNTNI